MRYFLKNVSKSNLYLNKLNNKKKQILVYNARSNFGKITYKNQLSKVYRTKRANIYFAKKRNLKSLVINLDHIAFAIENGFCSELILVGLGYKVQKVRAYDFLHFELHFSHKLFYLLPKNVAIRCIKKRLVFFSAHKSQLVNVTTQVKAFRFPNTYKGKGIRYANEVIKLKPGKQR